jgi:hypothetical protein
MTGEKWRSTSRRLVGGVVGVVTLAAALVVWTEPASAHTNAEAIRYGCGDSYQLVRSEPMIGGSGSTVGHLLLGRISGTSTYCAVTRKIASHNTNTRTYVCIADNIDWVGYCDDGSFSHFASVPGFRREGASQVWGRFRTANGVWASAEVYIHF